MIGVDSRKKNDCPSVHPQVRCTEEGWIYEFRDRRLGPFVKTDFDSPDFDEKLAAQLGCELNDILKAKLQNYQSEITLYDLNRILATTIKRDEAAKSITCLNMLLAQTNEDAYNVAFQSESSTGKSYIPLETAEYFPSKDVRIYAGASPTSFFHQVGKWMKLVDLAKQIDLSGLFDEKELSDEKRKVIFVDLESKILIFLDLPHWMLIERLRPLLSHDKRGLRYDITDKTGKGGLRTKTVVIRGFAAVIFATAKPTQEDQERTRLWLLSPEVTEEKLQESLRLLGARVAHREAWREWIDSHPLRSWLRERIRAIRATGVRDIVIPEWQSVLERFMAKRPHLNPRFQRDWPRLLSLIKALALLNCFTRVRVGESSIMADQRDIEAAITLYEQVATANELGLSPESYRIYSQVILPLAANGGVSRKEILSRYFELNYRPLPDDRLRKQILPALESAGLISQQPNPEDRREILVYCTVPSPISQLDGNRVGNGAVYPQTLAEKRDLAKAWLADPKNLDEEGFADRLSLTDQVGPETIHVLEKEGEVQSHPTKANRIHLVHGGGS